MTDRITKKQLSQIVDALNVTLGQPTEAWSRQADGTLKSAPGVYVIDAAYGGYRLGRIVNTSGGQSDVSDRGTARELYTYVLAMLAGINVERHRAGSIERAA